MAPDETTTYPAMEPITYADGTEPPMLLVHGTSDDVVGVGNAERLATKIRWAGGQVRVIEYKDVGHVGVVLSLAKSFRFIAPTLKDVTDYFTEQ
jgi:dipeptidyl aminopeptidase/acylaminoacyl peptidase